MKYHLFEVYGIEAEYMIVDKTTLNVSPLAEYVLQRFSKGNIENEVEVGQIAWSNELVSHVIEIKTNGPTKDPIQAEKSFHESLRQIQKILDEKNAMLLPTSMHPWMDTEKETVLWPHGHKDIYLAFDRIFNCKGHGWSNVQSVHLNLPFADEAEFARLHAALRLILPLVPFLSASSPFFSGKLSDVPDSRLIFYEANQKKVSSVTGDIIPEQIFSFKEYHELYERIYADISPFDPENILQKPWLNSRGVIAKFDVGALELRIMDIQEAPIMDFTILEIIILILQDLVDGRIISFEEQKKFSTPFLKACLYSANLFDCSLNAAYMKLLGFDNKQTNLRSFCEQLEQKYRFSSQSYKGLKVLSEQGRLAERLKLSFDNGHNLKDIYQSLAKSLELNAPFLSLHHS